jgi:hypothetical protein
MSTRTPRSGAFKPFNQFVEPVLSIVEGFKPFKPPRNVLNSELTLNFLNACEARSGQ